MMKHVPRRHPDLDCGIAGVPLAVRITPGEM